MEAVDPVSFEIEAPALVPTELEPQVLDPEAMKYGDDVVLYMDPDSLVLVRLAEKSWTDNQFGKFRHEFFVGKPFGSKIMSLNNKGYVYALRLTPDLFTKTLLHRTQILYFPDISLVIHNLGLEEGSVAVESGGLKRNRQLLDDILSG
jgi:tRNA (adenine57-N1/adenine58-N1)-methyltransferase